MTNQERRNEVVFRLNMAKAKAVEQNNYKPVYWKDVAKKIGIDSGNLSKITTGVIEPGAGLFLDIIDALGMRIIIQPKGK